MAEFDTHRHDFVLRDPDLKTNATRTFWVVIVCTLTMVLEIIVGFSSHSMALLADGWHMATHIAALSVSLLAYRLAGSERLTRRLSFGGGKFIPLGGYTSGILLIAVAVTMLFQSLDRLLRPELIHYDEALIVTCVGLIVNLLSVALLSGGHSHGHDPEHEHGHSHEHEHSHAHEHHHPRDLNMQSAYLHVLADLLTSVLAIFALLTGKFLGIAWMDAAIGLIGAIIVLKWSISICRDTAWELLDGLPVGVSDQMVRDAVEDAATHVGDIHVWRIAPGAMACELVVHTRTPRGSSHYQAKIRKVLPCEHIVVEERVIQ